MYGAEVTKAVPRPSSLVISKCPSRCHEGEMHISQDLSLEPNCFTINKIFSVQEHLDGTVG